MTRPLTKRELIEKLSLLDLSDDTPVVKRSGCGFDDTTKLSVERITKAFPFGGPIDEYPAIVID